MFRIYTISTVLLITLGLQIHSVADSRSVEFVYDAQLDAVPETAESVMMWVPLPVTTRLQTIRDLRVETTHPYEIVTDEKFGNRFVHVDIPAAEIASLSAAPRITVTFKVTRKSMPPMKTGFTLPNIDRKNLELYLNDSSLVVSTGPVAIEAKRIAGDAPDSIGQARRLYEHIVETVDYDKSGDGWGRGDSLYACDVRAGNCTDFHSLFIGEARSLNIPARFLMGFPLPIGPKEGAISGYHCWAEFFSEKKGWLPIDASEARKRPDMRDKLFAGLDEHRVEFTMGRDIVLPKVQQGPLNYAIYPYAEVDGQTHTGISASYRFADRD